MLKGGPFKQTWVGTNFYCLKNTKNVLFALEISEVFLANLEICVCRMLKCLKLE